MAISIPTKEDLAVRATPEALERQANIADKNLDLAKMSGSVPALVMILNQHRQIVYASERLLALLNIQDSRQICGVRFGDVFQCRCASTAPGGCGTSPSCHTCGSFQAILAAQGGEHDMRECRIAQEDGEALDFRVWTMPMTFNDETFTLVSVLDISDEKRRRALERVFFHDIMNTAVGMRGLTELLANQSPDNVATFQPAILTLAKQLIEEIQEQRDLLNAENKALAVKWTEMESRALVMEMIEVYRNMAMDRKLALAAKEPLAEVTFSSDAVLLRRVLGNLIKNAIEASDAWDTISVSCELRDDEVLFCVHNPAVIPPDVQAQLFQRSFSTKGEGRGLGTYSIKLLTEKFLNGRVSFTSEPDKGTTFCVQYPITGHEKT